MALAMTRPTKRDDCATLQFKRRTPKHLAARKGEAITFRFPDVSAGEIEVTTRIGDVIKFSLRTRDPYVAKLRCALANGQLERYTQAVASGPRRLTNKEVAALAGHWYHKGIALWEEDPEDAEVWRCLARGLESLREGEVAQLRRELGDRTDQVLAENSLVVDQESRDRLLMAIREAERLGATLLARRAEGDYSPDPHAAAFPTIRVPGPGASLSMIVQAWKAETAAVGASDATTTKYERIALRFVAFLGHDDPQRVTTADVVRFKDHRLHEEGASPKTIKDGDLAALKTVFAWAVTNGRMPSNPAQGVTIKVFKNKQRGYSKEAAREILKTALSRGPGRRENPKLSGAMKWAPLLCAHSGARVGEIAQLRKEDIRLADGIWVMRLTIEAGRIKHRKDREVPLHPQVVELGFVEFVTASPDGYLFLALDEPGQFRARHRSLKNRLGEFARSVAREPRVPANHGWRHAFITRCREHGVDLEKRRMITGHAGEGTDETEYGDAAGLYEEICKLPSFDLK